MCWLWGSKRRKNVLWKVLSACCYCLQLTRLYYFYFRLLVFNIIGDGWETVTECNLVTNNKLEKKVRACLNFNFNSYIFILNTIHTQLLLYFVKVQSFYFQDFFYFLEALFFIVWKHDFQVFYIFYFLPYVRY